MYKTIICAIENSDEGAKVLTKALELSTLSKANLFVTHSIKAVHALISSTANGVANYAKCDVNLIKV